MLYALWLKILHIENYFLFHSIITSYFFFNCLTKQNFDQQQGMNYKNSQNSTMFFNALTFGTNTKPLNDVKRILGANIGCIFQIYKDKKVDNFNTMISG